MIIHLSGFQNHPDVYLSLCGVMQPVRPDTRQKDMMRPIKSIFYIISQTSENQSVVSPNTHRHVYTENRDYIHVCSNSLTVFRISSQWRLVRRADTFIALNIPTALLAAFFGSFQQVNYLSFPLVLVCSRGCE